MGDKMKQGSSNSDTKCPLPWIHTSIQTTGRVRSCCIAKEEIENNGKPLDVVNNSFGEIISSSSMRRLRDNMRAGKKDPNCNTCWVDEKNNKISKRMFETKLANEIHSKIDYDIEPTMFKDIQLGVGNICNLKCRTCSPYCSTKWIKEHKDRIGEDSITFNNLTTSKHTINSKFWEEFDEWSAAVGRLEIMGGEPFYMKEFEILIDRLIENGSSKHITISMSSNGTIYKEELVNKILENFKSLGIQFSIDGFGDHFDYLRHGNSWFNVADNLDKFHHLFATHPSFFMGITITLSQINMFYIREMHQMIEETYPAVTDVPPRNKGGFVTKKPFQIFNNTVHYPRYYSSNCIPESIKEQYLDKIINPENYGLPKWDIDIYNSQIAPLVNHVRTPSTDEDWNAFVKETTQADAYRHEIFSETFPELWELFKYNWSEK